MSCIRPVLIKCLHLSENMKCVVVVHMIQTMYSLLNVMHVQFKLTFYSFELICSHSILERLDRN